MLQECLGSRVQLNAHMIDGCFDSLVQGICQLLLVYIVLVLPHADGLRVNLYQFSQRVLHPSGNGDCAADSYIIFRQFFLGKGGGGVNGGAGFVGDDVIYIQAVVLDEFCRKFLCFQGGGTVADGNQGDIVLLDEGQGFSGSFCCAFLTVGYIEYAVVYYLACSINDGHLAAGAVARVQPHDGIACQRGLQQ